MPPRLASGRGLEWCPDWFPGTSLGSCPDSFPDSFPDWFPGTSLGSCLDSSRTRFPRDPGKPPEFGVSGGFQENPRNPEIRGFGRPIPTPPVRPHRPDGRGRLGAQFLIVYILVSSKPALQNPVTLGFGQGVAKTARETANSGQFSATIYGLFRNLTFL